MGRGQVVRHQVLVLAFVGSNPTVPARKSERTTDMPASEKDAKNDGEAAVLEAIAAMPEPDRVMAKQLHAIIRANAPALLPRTWYGMPAYTNGDKIVCFFRSKQKFGERYMTLGFNDAANLDDGNLWPISFALTKLTSTEETEIATLIKKAVS
jgi:uncharacterized protein YdhG (YjbR/CyaY superfamily)